MLRSTVSIAAALGVWGIWATLSAITQLVIALQRRSVGGQTPQIISGAISVLTGLTFLVQALQGADTITSIGEYAILGGLFFLVSAIRLNMLMHMHMHRTA